MIGKVSIGKTFKGCVSYVMDKKDAYVLAESGVRSESALYATQDFDTIRKQNGEIQNAVWHTSISFSHNDKVNDDLMRQVAQDYLDKVGLKENQYLIVRHNDTKHQHMHIISNRVGYGGEVVSDRWCKNRTARACDLLEKKYNLTVAKEQGKKNRMAQDKNPELKNAKEKIKTAIDDSLKKGVDNYDRLGKELKKNGIDIQFQQQSTGRINGVTFKVGDTAVKGSAVDPALSYKRLEKQLEQNKNKGMERTLRI